MAVAWESEVVAARALGALADRMEDPRSRARLLVLAAFNRAHASRLLARLSVVGSVPLPVPPESIELPDDLGEALRQECQRARRAAVRYQGMAQIARARADLASAWICELNQREEDERARELARLGASAAPRVSALSFR